VLVAFTILALMLTVLLRIFSDGFRGIGSADLHAAAALHAQSALAGVGAEIPLTVGEWAGEHDDGFRWQVSIGLYDEPAMLATLKSFIVYRIVASARRGSAEVTLSGLRIGAVQPALPEEGEDAAGGAASN
jgi:hypothetical protein